MKRFKYLVFLIIPIATLQMLNSQSWTQKGINIEGKAPIDYSAKVSMPDANTVAIGTPNNSEKGREVGHVRIFKWSGNTWVKKGLDLDGDEIDNKFGRSVSMPDTNTVAVGAPYYSRKATHAGIVRIYGWNGFSWVQKGLSIDGNEGGGTSGWSLSMADANTVAIGAPFFGGSPAGHVRIYSWNGSKWIQKGMDILGEVRNIKFGWDVSMPDANTVAISAPNYQNFGKSQGRVSIYSWDGNKWVKKGMEIEGEAAGDSNGYSISMPNKNTLAIGSYKNDGNGEDAGRVRIYNWNGNAWIQIGMNIDGEAIGDESGVSVSMPDANTVAIGSLYNSRNGRHSGHVRVYSLMNNTSIFENAFGDGLFLYPNPTNGDVSIDFGVSYSNVTLIIRNTAGQETMNKTFNSVSMLEFAIDGEPGIYFIEIASENKTAMLKVRKE